MQISSIPYPCTNFRSNKRSVYNLQGKLLYKTTTFFFRDDFDWTEFFTLIKHKYANTKKVNFIIEGCSNGPECYTCLMKLLTEMPNEAAKFLPITGRDIDKDNIISAQSGNQMGATNYDLYRINYHTKNKLSEFMNFKPSSNPEYNFALSPKPFLLQHIKFNVGNILNDIEHMPDKNNILLCRNLWLYLDEKTKQEIAYMLGQKFDATSLVGIGAFDNGAREALLQNGFVQSRVDKLFIKPSRLNYRLF